MYHIKECFISITQLSMISAQKLPMTIPGTCHLPAAFITCLFYEQLVIVHCIARFNSKINIDADKPLAENPGKSIAD